MRQARRFRLMNLGLAGLLCSVGCATSHFGTFPDRLDRFPDRRISAVAAVDAAEPYLDETFKMIRAARGSDWPHHTPVIRVKLRKGVYYVLKDNYPSMSADYGFGYAVKVNANTGEVTPPKHH